MMLLRFAGIADDTGRIMKDAAIVLNLIKREMRQTRMGL